MIRTCLFIAAVSLVGIGRAQYVQPAFEVASIRPNRSGEDSSMVYFRKDGFVARNATLRMLMAYAYHVKDFQISGGPNWMDSERFDITAKADASVAQAMQNLTWLDFRTQTGLMIQSLLSERFQLQVLHQPRDMPIYSLVVAKGVPKLTRSALTSYESDIRGRRGLMIAKGLSMAQLADILSWEPELGVRKVVDQTGIKGTFDFTLQWAWDRTPPQVPGDAPSPADAAPALPTALQEQLGLKLESTKGPVDYIVIERAEKPTEN